jgi:DNA-binding transcriptional regulator WhiA
MQKYTKICKNNVLNNNVRRLVDFEDSNIMQELLSSMNQLYLIKRLLKSIKYYVSVIQNLFISLIL